MLFRVSPEVTRDFVVIGSHAHRLAAIDAHSGDALWDIELGARIESSACMSACGNYVVVGKARPLVLQEMRFLQSAELSLFTVPQAVLKIALFLF